MRFNPLRAYNRYLDGLASETAKSGGFNRIWIVQAPFVVAIFAFRAVLKAFGWSNSITLVVYAGIAAALIAAIIYSTARFAHFLSLHGRKRREWADRLTSDQLRELLRQGDLKRAQAADAKHVLWSRGDD